MELSAIFSMAEANLLAAPVLFFLLGILARAAKSDLTIPHQLAETVAIYLIMAIGFKGGIALAAQPLTLDLLEIVLAAVVVSFALPFLAFFFIRLSTKLDRVNAAAIAGQYGSVSLVTFLAATQFLEVQGYVVSVAMIALLAVMETPAILSGLLLARRPKDEKAKGDIWVVLREILLNGTVVLLVGSLLIGYLTGDRGKAMLAPFLIEPFQGILCLFLLEKGMEVIEQFESAKGKSGLNARLILFGLYQPLIGALIALPLVKFFAMSIADATLFVVLFSSASYIAVPAAWRLTLPKANSSLYLTLSLGVTFPFNLVVGIPLYYLLVRWWLAL